jgi:acyl-CoA synthetase (AMP-forming)/AMP-acid ligase II
VLIAEPRTAEALGALSVPIVSLENLGGEARAGGHGGPPLEQSIDAVGAGPRARPTASLATEDLAILQFSSGTTAAPKPVALTHRAVLEQLRLLNDLWRDRPGLRHSGVSWLPLHHDMGLVGFLLSGMWRPTTVTLLQPEVFAAKPALWLRAIARYGASVSAAPSFGYALAAEKVRDEEMEGVDLSSWRVALNGAETVAPQTLAAFAERFARWGFRREAMTPVYGLAEATLGVTFSALDTPPVVVEFSRAALEEGLARPPGPAEPALALVSVGKPLAEMEIEIRPTRRPDRVAGARVGAVFARGPSLMSGYFEQPEATRAALRDGWLDTGDLGFLWNGDLFLVGRSKDTLIVRGRNVAPETLETAAARVAGVRPDGVAAVSDPSSTTPAGEPVLLFVERARRTLPAEEERIAVDASAAALAAAGVLPAEVVVLGSGELPRTTSGKVRRQEALRRWRAGSLRRSADRAHVG